MIYFFAASFAWILFAALIAGFSEKFNRGFWETFLISLATSPLGGYIFLQKSAKKSANWHGSKKKGPWSEWIARAERFEKETALDKAIESYHKALELLEDPEGMAKKFNQKYINSKISEIRYILSLLESKMNDEVKVVPLHGDAKPERQTRAAK